MQYCDKKWKEVRGQWTEEDDNVMNIGSTTRVHKGVIKDKLVGTLIREIDAKNMS